MRVMAYDPYVQVEAGSGVEQASLEALLADSDFVVPLAVPTPETENLIDARALARMKPTAFLVNASRGDLLDEAALEQALDAAHHRRRRARCRSRAGQLPPDDLARRSDVIATPHIGGVTPEAPSPSGDGDRAAGAEILLRGEIPPGAVNPRSATRLERFRRR